MARTAVKGRQPPGAGAPPEPPRAGQPAPGGKGLKPRPNGPRPAPRRRAKLAPPEGLGAPTQAGEPPRAGQPAAPGARGRARHGAPHHEARPGPRCPRCRTPLDEVATLEAEPVPRVVKWTIMPCPRCQEAKSMSIKMQPGGAYRWPRFDENAMLKTNIVKVSPAVAARCRYLGDIRWIEEQACAMFLDEKTKEMYGQPIE